LSDLTAVSLFAGVGGFDLAFQRAGVKVTAAVEIDKKCRDVLALQFPETKLFDDVKEVTGEQLRATGFIPERGIIAGGFPCQDLSIAGLRKGLGGERSGLFHEIIRLADELKPQFLILENVAGLLSSQRGKDMGIVITALVERGYGVCWRVLDSQNFGVPQRRRRVFIIASLGDHRRPVEILFESESKFWNLETSRKKRKTTADTTKGSIGVNSFQKSKRAQSVDDFESWVESETVPTLNVFDSGDSRTTTIVTQEPILFEGNRVGDPRFHDKVSPSVMARWGTGGNNVPQILVDDRRVGPTIHNEVPTLQAFMGTGGNNIPMAFNMRSDDTNNRMDVYEAEQTTSLTALQPSPLSHRSQTFIAQRQSNSKYKMDDKASTISQRDYKSATDLVIDNEPKAFDTYNQSVNETNQTLSSGASDSDHYGTVWKDSIVRRLTPKECERLQGFPDDWTASQADSSRYKMMGNAVTVPVVEWIIKRMVKLLSE
jgi:DNA (cytosine-5)-methyltransferase 1